MTSASISVLGVHRLDVTPELLADAMRQVHGFEPGEDGQDDYWPYINELLSSVALVEVLVTDPDERFNAGEFAQKIPGVPSGMEQVAWLETYLSADGLTCLSDDRRYAKPPGDAQFRVAFYIHDWDPEVALSSSYGELVCPPLTTMPQRLWALAPYEAP